MLIKDLVIKKRFTDYYANVIILKTEWAIKIVNPNNYQLIKKLKYLAYKTRPNIVFLVK